MFYDNLKVIMESDENSMMVDSMTVRNRHERL